MPPTVSINLCCYNSEKYLEETLESIFAQTYKDWELVIVNDGSTDSTERIIQKYIADGWPIVYHYQPNAGLGRSRNKAIELSQGKFIAFIDHDDIWMPEKLEKQMSLFSENPDIGLVYSNSFEVSLLSNLQTDFFCWHPPHRGYVLEKLVLDNFISMPTVVLRADVLAKVGDFRVDLMHSEDFDMWLRIAESYPFGYVDEALATYRVHEESVTRRNPALCYLEDLIVLKDCIERNPELRFAMGKQIAKKRSDLYIDLAVVRFRDNMKYESTLMLLKGLSLYPMNIGTVLQRVSRSIRFVLSN